MVKKLPRIISREEYEKLLKAASKVKYVLNKNRRQYILAMILGGEAGLRISEIVGLENRVPVLTKDKINLQAHTIRIESGKGKKDRVVPVPLRFTEKHLKMLPLKIQRRALQHFITKLGKDVLGKDISFHTLRHYFGSQCAERMPLHEVQMLLGHSRLDTTGIYLHANPKQAVEAARKVFE